MSLLAFVVQMLIAVLVVLPVLIALFRAKQGVFFATMGLTLVIPVGHQIIFGSYANMSNTVLIVYGVCYVTALALAIFTEADKG